MPNHPIDSTARAWIQGRLARDDIAPATARSYGEHLAMLAVAVGPDREIADITTEQLEAWLAGMVRPDGQPVAGTTRNTRMATVRSFYRWAVERGMVGRDPTRLVRRSRVRQGPPRRMPAEQIAAVLDAAPFRSRVIVTVAVQLMVRRGELARMRVEHWDRGAGTLLVLGKGGRDRVLPVPVEAVEALSAWLADGRLSGPMWPSSHRPGRGLSERTISAVVTRAAAAAGVGLHLHALRHTGASDMAAAGAPVETIRHALGHSSLATTSIYVRASGREVAAAIEGRTYRRAVTGAG